MTRIFKEPLLHFLALGAAFFLWFHWRGGGAGQGGGRIVLTSGQIDHLAASFTKVWQRPPSEEEVKGLVDEWVREEIAVREATTAGLERDDTIIRRRLRQKLEFLVEDAGTETPPTDAELQAWLDAHADSFRIEPQLALRQVFLNPERRGAALESDTRSILAGLQAAGPAAPIDHLGDPTMLPAEVARAPLSDIMRTFGEEFSGKIASLAPGTWTGPVVSGYGLHLVLVSERLEGSLPQLADVRPAVEREFQSDRRKRQLAAMYERLLAKYEVLIEKKPVPAPADAAGAPKGGS